MKQPQKSNVNVIVPMQLCHLRRMSVQVRMHLKVLNDTSDTSSTSIHQSNPKAPAFIHQQYIGASINDTVDQLQFNQYEYQWLWYTASPKLKLHQSESMHQSSHQPSKTMTWADMSTIYDTSEWRILSCINHNQIYISITPPKNGLENENLYHTPTNKQPTPT